MSWTLITAQTLIPARQITTSANINAIAVIVLVENLRTGDPGDWYKAGYLEQVYQGIADPEVIGELMVKSDRVKLGESQLIYLDQNYLPCEIRFTPVDWLNQIAFRAWRLQG